MILICDDDVDGAAIGEIGERDGASVILVGHADALRDIDPTGGAAVQVHARPFVPRQARVPEGRPTVSILEQPSIGAGDLGHRVPIALPAIGRDEPVDDEELVGAVVIEVAELRAPRPASVGDLTVRDVPESRRRAHLIEPEIVVLKEISALGDVRHEGIEFAAVESVA